MPSVGRGAWGVSENEFQILYEFLRAFSLRDGVANEVIGTKGSRPMQRTTEGDGNFMSSRPRGSRWTDGG